MSKADEMFKELGYKKLSKEEIQEEGDIYPIIESAYSAPLYNSAVLLDKKTIKFVRNHTFECSEFLVTMQELQAINEKCKELGWLDKEE